MESRLIIGFMVYVNDEPKGVRESLIEAKYYADHYKPNRAALRIESMAAPAPTRFWNYDYSLEEWVERL